MGVVFESNSTVLVKYITNTWNIREHICILKNDVAYIHNLNRC